jgi:hypothetical protein
VPFTLKNLKEDLEDVGSNFDGAPDLEFRLASKALVAEAPYSSSVTWRPHVTGLPDSSFCCIAMWTMNRFGAAPCQWFSPGSKNAVAGADRLDRAALALAQPDAFGDEDRLAVRVGAPVGRYSARSMVTLKSSDWRSIASMSPSNWPMRTTPLKNGASLS